MFDINGYTEATSLAQALELLSSTQNAQLIAGGTDVLIKARERKTGYIGQHLISISRISDLHHIVMAKDGAIHIGAAATFTEVEKSPIITANVPALAYAVGQVGGPQIRNMGTIGGNVANGATSADSAPTLFAYNAKILLQSKTGTREVSIHDFYQGPGKVNLAPGEIMTAIKIEQKDYDGFHGNYIKFAQRKAMDIANLGCAVVVKEKDGKIEDLRVAFGVAGPTPLRATVAEDFAKGQPLNAETLQKIGLLCLESSRARDSWRASKAFREQLIRELPGRAILSALEEN